MKDFPKISIVVPTKNEEDNITCSLLSIFEQSYPKDKLEVFIADDNSKDKTIKLAKRFPVKILRHFSNDPEVGKMLAFNKATGNFFIYLDADIRLPGRNWFKKMLKPLLEDRAIAASFTRYYSDSHSTPIEKFLNLDPLQLDPIYQYFTPAIQGLISKKKRGYDILTYQLDKIPPAGLCLHRRDLIKPLVKGKRFLELDLLVILVKHDHSRFAYVPQAGLYHHHVKSLGELIKKRARNVQRVYLTEVEKRHYRWFDLSCSRDRLRIFIWIVYAHLIFPSLLRGLYKAIKHKEPAGLLEAIITPLITDVIIFSFLKDPRGRKLILDGLRK